MLPMVAAMAMGALSKQRSALGSGGTGADAQSGGLMGLISQFMGSGHESSMVDNVLGMASKLFNK